jgi:iron complex outermembrane receptor protein
VQRRLVVLSAGTGDRNSPLGGRGDIELSLGFDRGRTDIVQYASRAYDVESGFENGDDRTLTMRLLFDQTIGARGDLRGAFTLSDVRHDEALPNVPAARYRQQLMSIGGENIWRLIEGGSVFDNVRFSVGGAFDIASTPETGGRAPQEQLEEWGARAGVSAALRGSSAVLHAGASRRGRFPALRELYSGALDRFMPNPDLRPENLVALETGVTTRFGRGELQAVLFSHRLNDAVVRITLPDRKFLRVNRNRLESRGIELFATQTFGPLQLSGDLTVQSVDLTDTEADVTNRPENLPEVFGRAEARFPLLLGVNATAEADYIGSQFCIDPGTGSDAELDAGTHYNVEVSRTWSLPGGSWLRRLEARVAGDNITNAARYDQCGLPQPGRLLRFQLRLF